MDVFFFFFKYHRLCESNRQLKKKRNKSDALEVLSLTAVTVPSVGNVS